MKLLRRFRYWWNRRQRHDELSEEMEFHRAMKREALEEMGVTLTRLNDKDHLCDIVLDTLHGWCLHFYTYEVDENTFKLWEKNVHSAEHFGFEV